MPQDVPPWRRALELLLYGWMPVGIGWQLLHSDRLDSYSMLGWFLWPVAPLCLFLLATCRARLRRRR